MLEQMKIHDLLNFYFSKSVFVNSVDFVYMNVNVILHT